MEEKITIHISTEKGANEFQVRLLPDEGVGLLTTKDDENYLILDSLDYWYDLIQDQYPKKKKCTCKNTYFFVWFNYIPRPGTNDIREVKITTTCTACSKTTKPISIDIDYSPTDQLIENPITYCETPDIKYQFTQLTSYWSGDNLKDFLSFIFFDLKLNVYCWFWEHPANVRKFEKVSFEKAVKIITVNHQFLNFYFTANELDHSKLVKLTNEKGVYLNNGIWRKDEIIQLSAPLVITGHGLLYYTHFCNQYLDRGTVTDKSARFLEITDRLKSWMERHFVTKRGKNCFDGVEAYEKVAAKLGLKWP